MIPLSRRKFLRACASSAAGAVSAGWLGSLVSCSPACSRQVASPPVDQQWVLADLHAHPMLNAWNELSPLAVRNPELARVVKGALNPTGMSWETSHQAGINLLCVSHFNLFDEWLSMPTDPNPRAADNTNRMINLLEEELERPEVQRYATIVHDAQTLQRVTRIPRSSPEFRTAVVHAIEGGHALGGSLAALDELARRGVAILTVTHFFQKGTGSAANSFPFFPDGNSRWPNEGLTEFGVLVVKKMHELGLVVDVSHGTAATVERILHESCCPVIATHVSARTLGDHAYSLYDEHIQEIGKRGGIVGVILMPYWLSNFSTESEAVNYGTLDDVVRTIVYVAKLAGVEHIGIGSDFAGYIAGPGDMTCLGEIDRLRRKLLSEFGEFDTNRIMAQNAINFLVSHWTYPRTYSGNLKP